MTTDSSLHTQFTVCKPLCSVWEDDRHYALVRGPLPLKPKNDVILLDVEDFEQDVDLNDIVQLTEEGTANVMCIVVEATFLSAEGREYFLAMLSDTPPHRLTQ